MQKLKGMDFYMKKIRIISFMCIFVFSLTTLSGCYDSRGIEDLAYVTALGIDITDNDVLSITFQISIPGTSSESGSSQSSKTENTTVECSSIDTGISLVNSYISKQLNLSHCKAIVFSEKIASKGLNKYIDTLSNNVEIRPDCNVIISRCTAKDFIENATPSIETLTARYYEVAFKSSEYTGYTTSTEFATFVNDIKNSFIQGSAILGGINNGENRLDRMPYAEMDGIDGGAGDTGDAGNTGRTGVDGAYKADETPIDDVNNIETFGTAVFHDDRLVGELTGLETLYLLLINEHIESCTLSVPNPYDNNSSVDLFVRKSKNPKINVDIINGSPFITVDLFIEAHGLTLDNNIDYTSVETIQLLEKSAENHLKSEVTNFLYKTSKDLNSDIFGFGKYALHKYLTWEDWIKSNWNENYKNSFFDVHTHVTVVSGSEFDKSP